MTQLTDISINGLNRLDEVRFDYEHRRNGYMEVKGKVDSITASSIRVGNEFSIESGGPVVHHTRRYHRSKIKNLQRVDDASRSSE